MTSDLVSAYDYEFDSSQVAIEPAHPRSSARLLVVRRDQSRLAHDRFLNLPEYLAPGTVLVVNESFVLPARFFAKKASGGALEGLYVEACERGVWAWLKGRVDVGDSIDIQGFGPTTILQKKEKRVLLDADTKAFETFLKTNGLVPLPPYIRAERERLQSKDSRASDREDYQTVFARDLGSSYSVAAPTASLHFDDSLMSALERRGVSLVKVRLDVGEGTFEPLNSDRISEIQLHRENVSISEDAWSQMVEAKAAGHRIIAVGTTALRAIESASRRDPHDLRSFSTDLFVRPPFDFKMADGLITNFHWPKSSLLVLVSAFMGPQWKEVYAEAVRERYRLFSFGDGMLIL